MSEWRGLSGLSEGKRKMTCALEAYGVNMSRTLPVLSLLMVLAVGLQACSEPSPPVTPSPLPKSRSVELGMTPFPYDISLQAVDETYRFVASHSDLVLYHLDKGVPWPEALAGTPFHPAVMQEINDLAAHRKPGQKVYLAITPNAQERNTIAGYWAEKEQLPLPQEWQGRTFDYPDVITAYLNYARYMIKKLKPDYFAYGIEVTCDFTGPNDPQLDGFLVLAERVYTVLKAEHPGLPIFLTICSGSFKTNDLGDLQAMGRRVLPYSDYVAISTYPYWIVPGMTITEANPADLPRDWFTRWASLAPEKPFAVAETGYPAEDLVMPQFGVHIKADPAWQAQYVAFMLQSLNDLHAQFAAWFISRDYDRLYDTLTKQGGEIQFYKLWRDTGLLTGDGDPRPALAVWDAWLHVPIEKQ